jgi:hypothetical protein
MLPSNLAGNTSHPTVAGNTISPTMISACSDPPVSEAAASTSIANMDPSSRTISRAASAPPISIASASPYLVANGASYRTAYKAISPPSVARAASAPPFTRGALPVTITSAGTVATMMSSTTSATHHDNVPGYLVQPTVAAAQGTGCARAKSSVTYCSTTVQTAPPHNSFSFFKIHGQEPTHQDLERRVGLAAIGRYKNLNDKPHGVEFAYVREFGLPNC